MSIATRPEGEVKDQAEQTAEAIRCSKCDLAAEAIHRHVELDTRQIIEIQAALNEANAGQFASDEEVVALKHRWTVRQAR